MDESSMWVRLKETSSVSLLLKFLVLAFAPMLFVNLSAAADVKCLFQDPNDSGICLEAMLLGPIEKGDFKKVSSFYAANHPWLSSFELQSPGGDVGEAIKIGRLFRRYLIDASGPTGRADQAIMFDRAGRSMLCRGMDCVCASSCALIWYGATGRFGTVGLHRPHFSGEEFKQPTPSEAEKLYGPSLDQIVAYLVEMEAPQTAIESMIVTSSATIKWVGADESYSHSFAEWLELPANSMRQVKKRGSRLIFKSGT